MKQYTCSIIYNIFDDLYQYNVGQLVVRMSRKHIDIIDAVDRRGYGSKQNGTVCDVCGQCPLI